MASCLPVKEAGPHGSGMATMPQGTSSHSPTKEADKLTLGQELNVKVPHAVVSFVNTQGHRFLSNSQLAQYEGLLCENPWVTLETVRTLNPATFLPTEEGEQTMTALR